MIDMTTQNYLMIYEATNIVENVCLWDGNPDTWQPPAGYLMMPQATTMGVIWFWDKPIDDWVLTQEMGTGQIGFIWNGTECVTNEPKPPKPKQPEVTGAQTL